MPATLETIALAAPLLGALDSAGVEAAEAVDLTGELAAADPRVAMLSGEESGAVARAVVAVKPAPAVLERAFEHAAELVVVLAAGLPPAAAPGWQLIREEPGPQPVLLELARLASAPRWRRRLLYSTSEHPAQWLAVFRAGAFGDDGSLRVYAFRAERPRAIEPAALPAALPPSRLRPAPAPRRRRIGPLATKLRRLLRAEWGLFRTRGR